MLEAAVLGGCSIFGVGALFWDSGVTMGVLTCGGSVRSVDMPGAAVLGGCFIFGVGATFWDSSVTIGVLTCGGSARWVGMSGAAVLVAVIFLVLVRYFGTQASP